MRGFLELEPRKFMLNLLRAIIIVCLVGHWFQIEQWLGYAADGLAQYRVDVNLTAIGQGPQQIAIGENVDQIRSIINEKIMRKSDGQNQLIGWDGFNPLQSAQNIFNADVANFWPLALGHISVRTLLIYQCISV